MIAVIFAVSLLSVPMTFASFNPDADLPRKSWGFWSGCHWWYETLYAGLIIFFCYFYNSVQFNPQDMAENLKKWGGFRASGRASRQRPTSARCSRAHHLGGALRGGPGDPARPAPPFRQHAVLFRGTSVLITVGVAPRHDRAVGIAPDHGSLRRFSKTGRVKGRWFNVGAGGGAGNQGRVRTSCCWGPGLRKKGRKRNRSERYKVPHISTGDIFRQEIAKKSELGLQVQEYVSSGRLVPDELVLTIVTQRLTQPDCAKGFLLDGFPRTVNQAEGLGISSARPVARLRKSFI